MRKSHLSFEQRVHNAYGSQEVENVRASHAFGHARNLSTREWGNIWENRPCLASDPRRLLQPHGTGNAGSTGRSATSGANFRRL